MTDLAQYMSDDTAKTLAEVGAFFADNSEEYSRHKVEGVRYARVAKGLICPTSKVTKFRSLLQEVSPHSQITKAVRLGCDEIIKKELYNRDSFWGGDIDDAIHSLSKFGFSVDEVVDVYNREADF